MFTRSFEQKGSSSIPRFFASGIAGCAASLFVFNTLYAEEKPAAQTHAAPDVAELMNKCEHNPLRWPSCHYALHIGRPDVAKLILELHPEQALQTTPALKLMGSHCGNNADQDYDFFTGEYESGISALELAVKSGDRELVKKILDLGANPNETRLEWNVGVANSWDRARWDGGGTINERVKFPNKDWDKRSILFWALQKPEIVDLLLEYGATLSNCYASHREFRLANHINKAESALKVAANLADLKVSDQVLRVLIFHQAKAAGVSNIGYAPYDTIRALVQNPAGLPALHYALSINDPAAFKLLLDHGFDPNDQGAASASLITKAVNDNALMMHLILDKYNGYSDSAFEGALNNQNTILVKQLLARYPANRKFLDKAISVNNAEMAKLILGQGPIKPYPEALEQVIRSGNDEIAQMLIRQGFTHPKALSLAIMYHRTELFSMLLDHGMIDDEALRASIIYHEPAVFEAICSKLALSAEKAEQYKKLVIESQLKHALGHISNSHQ